MAWCLRSHTNLWKVFFYKWKTKQINKKNYIQHIITTTRKKANIGLKANISPKCDLCLLNAWYQQIEWLTSHYFFTPLYPDLKWYVRIYWKMKNRNIYLLKLLYNDKNISKMLMYLNWAAGFMICICNTLLWISAAAQKRRTFSSEPILPLFPTPQRFITVHLDRLIGRH